MPEERSSRASLFAFEGRYTDQTLQRADISPGPLLEELRRQKSRIESELQRALATSLGTVDVSATIEFNEGSLEWAGHVHYVYQVVEVFANVGGAIAFCQLIGAAIRRVLRRYMPKRLPSPYTRVILVYAPPSRSRSAIQTSDFPPQRLVLQMIFAGLMLNCFATVVVACLVIFWKLCPH